MGRSQIARQYRPTVNAQEAASANQKSTPFRKSVGNTRKQVPALREIGRVVKSGGTIRLLEYVRPRGAMRRAITRLWEPWVAWVYGAGFDRRTEERVPEAGLEVVESRLVVDDLIKLISIRTMK